MATQREFDIVTGEASFNKVKGILLAIAAEKLVNVNADIEDAANAALNLVDAMRKGDRLAPFKGISEETLERGLDQKLEDVALAAQYITREATKEGAGATTVKVDVVVIEKATAVRKRMLKVAKHNLDDIPSVALEIADIELGSGYMDLANDLIRLITLYLKYAKELAKDRKHYDKEDIKEAETCVVAIKNEYRASALRESSFADLKPRAFTELTRLYSELRAAGRFVHRHSVEILDELPALRAAMGILGKRGGGGGGGGGAGGAGGGGAGGGGGDGGGGAED